MSGNITARPSSGARSSRRWRLDIRWPHLRPGPAELIARLSARIAEGRRRMREEPDAGYSTEAILVTALLVVLAIGVIAIIALKVTEAANGITLG